MPKKPLGCCEYTNSKGDTAHVLGCCCDCDVLDSACDRCLRCQAQKPDLPRQMSSIITDRLRIPWVGGAGAIQLQLDVFSPILIIPTLLVISITHYYAAWSISILTPLCLMYYYKCWRRNPQRSRTRFFFSWGLVSVFTMGYVFMGAAITFREIYLAEGMVVLGLFLLMLYTLYLTKQDPGSIRQDGVCDSFMRTVIAVPKGKAHPHTSNLVYQYGNSSSDSFNERLDKFRNDRTHITSPSPPESGDGPATLPITASSQPAILNNIHQKVEVPPKSGPPECEKCGVKLPTRASHCNVCQQCYSVRDHHCIWLDQCIGLRNHRAFIVTILLFLVVSIYGVHLTLTTICTPVMVFDYFLLPANCRFVYADLLGAIAYVSCCYTVVIIAMVIVLSIQQITLISQNVTIQEFNKGVLRRATAGRKTSWWKSFYIDDNLHNRGLWNNWLTFIRRTRHEPPRNNIAEEEMLE